MSRKLTASALLGLALLALTATGQPPPPQPKGQDKKPADKKADPIDAQIAAALANDPEVRIARAKVMLADAELAKARQLITNKVFSLNAAIAQQTQAVESAKIGFANVERLFKSNVVSKDELLLKRADLEAAKAKLAGYQMELKLITGEGRVGMSTPTEANYSRSLDLMAKAASKQNSELIGPVGPIPDRIRVALDKKVTLGPKGEKVTFEKALETFKKDAGLDVPVRILVKTVNPIISEGEELPVGAWFQMFADFNPEVLFLVREYGLLITAPIMSPPRDAPSVAEFWKRTAAPPPPYTPPKSLRVSGRHKGTDWQLTDAKALTQAAIDMAIANYDAYPYPQKAAQWEAVKAGDHLLIRMPDLRDFGFDKSNASAVPAELLFGLGDSSMDAPEVWMWLPTRNELLKMKDFKPAAVKAFTDALRKYTPVK